MKASSRRATSVSSAPMSNDSTTKTAIPTMSATSRASARVKDLRLPRLGMLSEPSQARKRQGAPGRPADRQQVGLAHAPGRGAELRAEQTAEQGGDGADQEVEWQPPEVRAEQQVEQRRAGHADQRPQHYPGGETERPDSHRPPRSATREVRLALLHEGARPFQVVFGRLQEHREVALEL